MFGSSAITIHLLNTVLASILTKIEKKPNPILLTDSFVWLNPSGNGRRKYGYKEG
jgi:hypothetical protein